MNIGEVLDHYGGVSALARAIKVSRTTIYKWIEAKQIPKEYQALIQIQTKGIFMMPRGGE